MPKAKQAATGGRTTRRALKAASQPPRTPDGDEESGMIDLTEDDSPPPKPSRAPKAGGASIKSEEPDSSPSPSLASSSRRGKGNRVGSRIWNTFHRLSSPGGGVKTPMSQAASETSSDGSSIAASARSRRSSFGSPADRNPTPSFLNSHIEEEDEESEEEESQGPARRGRAGGRQPRKDKGRGVESGEESEEEEEVPSDASTQMPPTPGGTQLDMADEGSEGDEDDGMVSMGSGRRGRGQQQRGGARGAVACVAAPSAETLPQAEVESALEDVNAAAARMGYVGAKEEGEEEDEEEGEGEGEGPVFSAAAADAVTTRLRDLDDGNAIQDVTEACFRAAAIEEPQTRPYMAQDLLAPVRAEDGQGNGAKDPERAFRRCIELMEGVKAAAANDRADVGDYVAAVDKALDTAQELQEEMRNRELHYAEQVSAKEAQLAALEDALAEARVALRGLLAGEENEEEGFAFDATLKIDLELAFERGMDLQAEREQAMGDLNDLLEHQALFRQVDGPLTDYTSFVVARVSALAEDARPQLLARRVQRVKALYRARRTLLRLFEAAVASTQEILQGIEADREAQADELAKLNRKYANAGPAIQEEKRRLAATIAEMNAQYDEHRLALEAMRQEHTNAKTDIILLLEDEKNEAEAEGLALPEDVEEEEAARPQGRAFCAVM